MSRSGVSAASPAIALALCLATPSPAAAAESYANCTGFVDTLPATLAAQGTWCLRHDLSTTIASGAAIAIAVNNVTLDCNGFKLGGLAAPPDTQAIGVLAQNRSNATVRGCNVRGFRQGIVLGGAGHLIEENRLDGNRVTGIRVSGDGSVVRGNRIRDTGSVAAEAVAVGVDADGTVDVLDNLVSGIASGDAAGLDIGIRISGGGIVQGNRVRNVLVEGDAAGIQVAAPGGTWVGGNDVLLGAGEIAIACNATGSAKDNLVQGAIVGCVDGGGNFP